MCNAFITNNIAETRFEYLNAIFQTKMCGRVAGSSKWVAGTPTYGSGEGSNPAGRTGGAAEQVFTGGRRQFELQTGCLICIIHILVRHVV